MKHRFLLDGQGQVTSNPDNTPGIADICDSLRYIGQNMFPLSGPKKPEIVMADPASNSVPIEQKHTQEQHEMMQKELAKAIGSPIAAAGTGKRGGFHWSI